MKTHKPTSNPNRIIAATMPMSQYSSVSGLFSGIAISYSFGGEGGYTTVFFGIVDTENGANQKTDYTADNNS
ncbi:MAG: hypothetical protein IKJ74_00610 [Clostridia bacterium]|nr:hypothetical protein [Clostridia bacterium]